jgi:hypothetical protein
MRLGAHTASCAVLLAVLTICATPRRASARERLAVLVVAEGDPGLSDRLTEVAISGLAERRDRDLVGLRELRRRLAGVVPDDDYAACLARAACVAEVGAAAGAQQVVIGTGRRHEGQFTLDLALADTQTGAILARASRTAAADAAALISAVHDGVDALFAAEPATPAADAAAPAPAAPPITLEAPPPDRAPARAGLDLTQQGQPSPDRRRASWAAYLGLGATTLAAVSFSAAAVRGGMATGKPVGATRVEVQADLDRRREYATQANTLLVAGSLLTATAAVAFLWWWYGDRGRER